MIPFIDGIKYFDALYRLGNWECLTKLSAHLNNMESLEGEWRVTMAK